MADEDPNPEAEELARLRQEKADREKSERDAEKAETEELRKYKADREAADAKKVTPPAKKTETKTTVTETKPEEKPEKKKSGVSSKWFGDAAND
jgi:hypothetical protein